MIGHAHSRSSSVTSSGPDCARARASGRRPARPPATTSNASSSTTGGQVSRVELAAGPALGELVGPLRLGGLVRLAAAPVAVGVVGVVVRAAVGLRGRRPCRASGRSTGRCVLPLQVARTRRSRRSTSSSPTASSGSIAGSHSKWRLASASTTVERPDRQPVDLEAPLLERHVDVGCLDAGVVVDVQQDDPAPVADPARVDLERPAGRPRRRAPMAMCRVPASRGRVERRLRVRRARAAGRGTSRPPRSSATSELRQQRYVRPNRTRSEAWKASRRRHTACASPSIARCTSRSFDSGSAASARERRVETCRSCTRAPRGRARRSCAGSAGRGSPLRGAGEARRGSRPTGGWSGGRPGCALAASIASARRAVVDRVGGVVAPTRRGSRDGRS